ncbi:hypothetical protein HDU67_004173 [Dinochytrium kinnereticum]|nr:hypothetical protein HDU67_004173 [Dinochytrium kinnereticum]
MYAVAKSIDSEAMGRWFEKLFSAEIKPNVYTYSLIMHEKSKLGEIAAVTHIFEEMIDSGVSPTSVTYTILANAFLRSSLTPNALRTVHFMLSEGSRPDAAVFYTAMKVFLKTKNHAKVLNLYDRLPAFGLEPNDLMDMVLFKSGLAASDFEACEKAVFSIKARSLNEISEKLTAAPTSYEKIITEVFRKKSSGEEAQKQPGKDRADTKETSAYISAVFDDLFRDLNTHTYPFKSRCLTELMQIAISKADLQNAFRFFDAIVSGGVIGKMSSESRTALYECLAREESYLASAVALSVMWGNSVDVDFLGIFDVVPPSHDSDSTGGVSESDPVRICETWNLYGSLLSAHLAKNGGKYENANMAAFKCIPISTKLEDVINGIS